MPVGVPAAPPVGLTVAVNVTLCPKVAGLGVATNEVVVSPLLIVSERMDEVLVLKLVSPE